MARSKRTFPERICKNPLCNKPYTPNYRKQKHHTPQCGTDHRNDLRDEKDRTLYGDVKLLKKMDKILAKMYARLYKEKFCWSLKELLAYEEVDMSLSVKQELNSESKRQIRWFFCYGIEFREDQTHFIIHTRNKDEISKD